MQLEAIKVQRKSLRYQFNKSRNLFVVMDAEEINLKVVSSIVNDGE